MKSARAALLTILLLVACGEYRGELPSNVGAFAPFASLPGRIGVTIRGAESKIWRFQISKGQVSATEELPSAPRSATSVGVGLETPSGMLERGELVPRGPFAYSREKAYLAAAMDLKPPRDSVARHLAVIRVADKQPIYESGEELSSVEAIAWSPDGQHVAVLRRARSSMPPRPIDILSAMFGHPVQYSNYWVEVIGVEGKSFGRAQIASDVKAGWGEIVWTH